MTKQRFKKVLDTLTVDWAQKDYDHAAGFFATDVKYGDPTRYNQTFEKLDSDQQDWGT
jgi:hypothetical protein